jgi:hypothetical protein
VNKSICHPLRRHPGESRDPLRHRLSLEFVWNQGDGAVDPGFRRDDGIGWADETNIDADFFARFADRGTELA